MMRSYENLSNLSSWPSPVRSVCSRSASQKILVSRLHYLKHGSSKIARAWEAERKACTRQRH